MKDIYLIRHGRSSHNLGNVFAGNSINEPLIESGKNDAKLMAKKILESGGKITHIFHSPLKRSEETAEIIKNILEKKLSNKIKLIELKNLSEVNVGLFSGKTREQVLNLFPKAANAFYKKKFYLWDFPKGENFDQALLRVKKLSEEILMYREEAKDILIVAHAMINRIFLANFYPELIKNHQTFYFEHDLLIKLKTEKIKT